MVSNLKLESSAKFGCSSVLYQKESNMVDNKSDISCGTRNRRKQNKSKLTDSNTSEANTKTRTTQNKNNSPKSNEGSIKKSDFHKKAKGVNNKRQNSTTSSAFCPNFQSNTGPSNHLQNLQTQKDVENYARQVYNDIIIRSQQNSIGTQNTHYLSNQQRMINNNQTHRILHGSENQEIPSLLNPRFPQSLSQWRPFKPNYQVYKKK